MQLTFTPKIVQNSKLSTLMTHSLLAIPVIGTKFVIGTWNTTFKSLDNLHNFHFSPWTFSSAVPILVSWSTVTSSSVSTLSSNSAMELFASPELIRWLKLTHDILLYYFSFLFQVQEFLILNDLFVKQEVNVLIQIRHIFLNFNDLNFKKCNPFFNRCVLPGFYM